MRKIICLLLSVCFLSALSGSGCADSDGKKHTGLRRLDDDGYLYYMDYTEDYYSSEIIEAMSRAGLIDSGCSSFFTYNPDGDPISCRNYDYPHRYSEEDRSLTGLNIVLHCKPEGKYESVAMADAIWCDESNLMLRPGGPDQEDFDTHILDVIPYECMDGINEKGLHVAILKVDIRDGDESARMIAGSSIILRYILDDCANVEEAIDKVHTSIVQPEDWQDNHLFITDAMGHYAVIESRNGEVSVVESDIVTNFYLSADDLQDYYRNNVLREAALKVTDENGEDLYHFGYGHGYHRFIALASQLAMCQARDSESYRTVMPEERALVLLQSVAQNPYTASAGISMTQYSAIYNNAARTLTVWPFQNYSISYSFDITGRQLSPQA